MSNLVPVSDIERMALAVAKSGLFGIKTPEQGVALMLIAQAEGLHPAIAARDYHVIQGRPALKADAMLARFQQAGGRVEWKVYTNEQVTGAFSHPAGGSVEVTWTIEEARKIGLANKENWRNYPRAMLRSRVASEGIRAVFPGVVVGTYTDEETESFTQPKVKDMGMVEEVKAQVEEIIESVEPVQGFALLMPGQDEPFKVYESVEEWIKGYCSLVARIMGSNKVADAEKPGKLALLGQANIEVIKGMSGMESARWKAAVVEAGGTLDPKPSKSLSLEEEPNEQPF